MSSWLINNVEIMKSMCTHSRILYAGWLSMCSIGVRMAIGARRIDIQKMFIIEAVILTLFGGLLGVIVGSLISYILAIINGWAFFINSQPVILGFSVSVLVGILSGWYPALRASRLNPIQILTS